jgi:hypothetical protein
MMNKQPKKQSARQWIFTCLRYGGLLVTVIGVVMMFVPGACPKMLHNIEGYMILSGSIMNAIGRINVAKDPCPMSANNYCRTIAEGLQDVALIL